MEDMKLTALVTGASAGLGQEFCRQLAERCDVIIAVARRRERLEALAQELEGQAEVHVIEADLTTVEGLTRATEAIRQKGPVDYLVNNAGFGSFGRFADVEIGRQQDLVRLHIDAPMVLARAALPFMRERGRGWLINVGSLGGFGALPKSAVYSGAKSFLLSLSQSLALELKDAGIRVQCLCPGLVRTEIHHNEDMADMDTALIAEEMWMEARDVVAESLAALESGPLVLVPGEGNREAARAMVAGLLDQLQG